MRYLIAIIVLLMSAYNVFAADPFTVSGVGVDATGQTAIEAQTTAIQNGQLRAAERLITRLTPQGSTLATPLDIQTAAKMIRGLEIANEKRSANRYLGDITVAFNPSLIQQYIRSQDLTMIATQSRDRLVIPVSNGLVVGGDDPWGQAWSRGGYTHALTPVKALGAGQMVEGVTTADELNTIDILRGLGARYGVEQILIASVTGDAPARVRLTDIALDTGTQRDLGAVSGQDYSAATLAAVNLLENEWKRASVTSLQNAVSIPVSVLYSSHQEWLTLQDAINGSGQIQAARLDAVSKDGALMTLTYGGDIARLRNELAFKGVDIRNDPKLGMVLTKSGRS